MDSGSCVVVRPSRQRCLFNAVSTSNVVLAHSIGDEFLVPFVRFILTDKGGLAMFHHFNDECLISVFHKRKFSRNIGDKTMRMRVA